MTSVNTLGGAVNKEFARCVKLGLPTERVEPFRERLGGIERLVDAVLAVVALPNGDGFADFRQHMISRGPMRRALVIEHEDPPARRQRRSNERPERLEPVRRNMRQPKRKDDGIKAFRRAPLISV